MNTLATQRGGDTAALGSGRVFVALEKCPTRSPEMCQSGNGSPPASPSFTTRKGRARRALKFAGEVVGGAALFTLGFWMVAMIAYAMEGVR